MCIWSGLAGLFDAFIYCISPIPWLHLINTKLNILIICTFCYSLQFFWNNQEMTIHFLNTSSAIILHCEQFYFFFGKRSFKQRCFSKRSFWCFFYVVNETILFKKLKCPKCTINLWNKLVFWLISFNWFLFLLK